MPDYAKLISYLKQNIDGKRLAHSIGTADEAVKLARKFGADENKAYVAGLLHDVAKGKCKNGLNHLAYEYGIDIDEIESKNIELIHGRLGAAMIEKQLGIHDEEILSAIRWHTTGHKGMTLLEKIIYLADLIEPGRSFEGINEIRLIAYQNIDKAMREALKQVLGYVQCEGFELHPCSVEAYNDFNKEEDN
jgi:predicted HD superfamily hydrolase involved in NAD metabolism